MKVCGYAGAAPQFEDSSSGELGLWTGQDGGWAEGKVSGHKTATQAHSNRHTWTPLMQSFRSSVWNKGDFVLHMEIRKVVHKHRGQVGFRETGLKNKCLQILKASLIAHAQE